MARAINAIFGVMAGIALAFVMYVSLFVYYEPIHRQSREPVPELGYTIPHEIKGATFYVTPLEDRLLDLQMLAGLGFVVAIFTSAAVDTALKSRRRSPAITGLPFTRVDGLPVIVRLGALVATLACLGIWVLQTPPAQEYGVRLPDGCYGDHIWITALIGVFCLLLPKRIWTVTEEGLTREVRGLLGRKVEHFGPPEIKKVTVREHYTRNKSVYYALEIVLVSGRKITFEVGDDFGEAWAVKSGLEGALGHEAHQE